MSFDDEPDVNITDDYVFVQEGGAVTRSQTKAVQSPTKAKPVSPVKPVAPKQQTKARVLIDGLTEEQDKLLQTVQYKTGLLGDQLHLGHPVRVVLRARRPRVVRTV